MIPTKGGPWLQTHRGLAWMADAPELYPYDVSEIAHALSHLCRFAGHTTEFYSVAQHSVLVAREVRDRCVGAPDMALLRAALLHDAAEAFCIDLPQPIKRMPEMAGYRALIGRTEKAIAEWFGLSPYDGNELIARADLVLLATEKRDILNRSTVNGLWSVLPDPLPVPVKNRRTIYSWDPVTAREGFLAAWTEWGGGEGAER